MLRYLFAGAVTVAMIVAGPVLTQGQQREPGAARKAAKEQKVEVQTLFRMSTITGMPVKNAAGKDLGKIEDLAIELNSGDIRYAALSFGGFASLGDKLFAVPWKAMSFKFGETESYFVFDVSEEQLKRAPGFDQNKWPDMADPAWAKEVDAAFAIRPDRAGKTATEPDREAAKPGRLVYDAVYRGANITGMKVKNDRNEDLGSIYELVIDMKPGKVRYAALSFGGVLGLGDKLFAIPWTALKFKHEATDKHFVLHVSPERLKSAKGFDEDHWPNVGDPRWSREIDEFYKEDTVREANVPKRTK